MQLERQARLPLLVRHLEEIDLGDGTGDIQQRFDSAERLQRLIDHCPRSRRLGQIEIDDQGLGSGGPHRDSRLLQIIAIPRDQGDR